MENVTSQGSSITIQLPGVWKEAPLQSAARWSWASVLPGPSVRSRGRCSWAFASALPFCSRETRSGKGKGTPHTAGKVPFREFGEMDWRPENPQKAPASGGSGNPHPAPRTALTTVARPRRRAREPSVPLLSHALVEARRGEPAPASQQRRTRSRQSRAPALQRPRRRSGSPGQLCEGEGVERWRAAPSRPPARPARASASSHGSAPPAGQASIGAAEGQRSREALCRSLAGDLVPMGWPAPRGYLRFPKGPVASRGPTQRAISQKDTWTDALL